MPWFAPTPIGRNPHLLLDIQDSCSPLVGERAALRVSVLLAIIFFASRERSRRGNRHSLNQTSSSRECGQGRDRRIRQPLASPRVSSGSVALMLSQPPLTLPLYLDSDGSSERAAARDALRSRDRGRAWGAARRFAMSPNSCVGVNPNRKAGTRRLLEQADGRRAYEQIGPDVRWYRRFEGQVGCRSTPGARAVLRE